MKTKQELRVMYRTMQKMAEEMKEELGRELTDAEVRELSRGVRKEMRKN